ncbi:Uncharacterized protein conserved in bacteria [Anaerostipes hadrus]|uniref:Uncharacterized protein conserved in bacteria n=1 Tax=Anaerostipes hadrus TaxID=649756 RepID=A0A174P111_ANAHA|nr:HNH endonuclease signature motif containing protein [Anaerostipes hadrus]CUP51789.1 Uncharacterized protein conserved in bacteria [Anaerostipes hadrus]
MFVGYVLKKTASGTTSYIVESPSGGISKTTDKSQATIFPSKAKIKKGKDHAPKKTSGFIIEELSKSEPNPGVTSDPIPMPAQQTKEIQSEDMSKRIVFPQETRMSVYNQSEGRCVYCGRFIPFDEMTIDHIVPLSKGGTNYEKNLQCCCKECNLMKQDLLERDFCELPIPCGTVVSMEGASDSRNNYSSLTRRFWLFVPIRAYSLMPLSL